MHNNKLPQCIVAIFLCFYAESVFAVSTSEAMQSLRAGEYDTALTQFQELQVDAPNDPDVLYGLGCVQYQRGLSRLETQQTEEAKTAFQEARTAFNSVLSGTDKRLQPNAGFNLANVFSKEAEAIPAEDAKTKNFKMA